MFRPDPPVREILAIRLARLGDVILLLPALSRLKRSFPGARMTFLTGAPCASIARLCPEIDEVIAVDRVAMRDGSLVRAGVDILRLLRTVRRRRFDLVVDFHSFRETNLLSRLSGARRRIALKRRDGAYLAFCFNLPPVREDKQLHVGEMFRRVADHVARRIGAPVGTDHGASGMVLGSELLRAVRREYLAASGSRPLAVAYLGAPVPERRWPAERFAEAVRHVVTRWDADVVLLSGRASGEREFGDRVARLAGYPDRVRHFAGLDVPEMAAIIHEARLLISNDTGPMHLGPALGVPTLALFSVGFPDHFRPTGTRDRYLRADPITDIRTADVVGAIDALWEERAGAEED